MKNDRLLRVIGIIYVLVLLISIQEWSIKRDSINHVNSEKMTESDLPSVQNFLAHFDSISVSEMPQIRQRIETDYRKLYRQNTNKITTLNMVRIVLLMMLIFGFFKRPSWLMGFYIFWIFFDEFLFPGAEFLIFGENGLNIDKLSWKLVSAPHSKINFIFVFMQLLFLGGKLTVLSLTCTNEKNVY